MRISACLVILFSGGLLLLASGRVWSQDAPTTLSSQKEYQEQTAILGGLRSFEQGVLTVRLPRSDLWVQNDMGEIPTGAGIESSIYFYRCPCGKDRVAGQLAVADFEVNNAIDALRKGQIEVVSVGAMFIGDKPRMMALRFQGEGDATELARTIKAALEK